MMPEDYYLTEEQIKEYERWFAENREDIR